MTLSVKCMKMQVSKMLTSMYKVVCLQCSWIKQLYDNNLHNWKEIPLHMIIQNLGKVFISF